MRDLIKRLQQEASDDLPPGYESKKATTTVKRVTYDKGGLGGLDFLVSGKIYDAYLKDYIGSISPGIEKSIDYLIKAKYTEDEIDRIFSDARKSGGKINLPKPVKVTFSVLKRKR